MSSRKQRYLDLRNFHLTKTDVAILWLCDGWSLKLTKNVEYHHRFYGVIFDPKFINHQYIDFPDHINHFSSRNQRVSWGQMWQVGSYEVHLTWIINNHYFCWIWTIHLLRLNWKWLSYWSIILLMLDHKNRPLSLAVEH